MTTREQLEQEAAFLGHLLENGATIRHADGRNALPVKRGIALRESCSLFGDRPAPRAPSSSYTPRPVVRTVEDCKDDLLGVLHGSEDDHVAERARAKFRLQKLLPTPAPQRPAAVGRIKASLLRSLGKS